MNAKRILESLGYDVDKQGNIRRGINQLALLSLEADNEGGLLRIHSDAGQFFFDTDPVLDEIGNELAFPTKVSKKYIYFNGDNESFKINVNDFEKNALVALKTYHDTIKRDLAG